MSQDNRLFRRSGIVMSILTGIVLCLFAGSSARAENLKVKIDKGFDGPQGIVWVSAPSLLVEVEGGQKTSGTCIVLGTPKRDAYQQWIFTSKDGEYYSIHPAHTDKLVLAVAGGSTTDGAMVLLETDNGKDSQLWSLRKMENGAFLVTPKHASDKCMANEGANAQRGARAVLWSYGDGSIPNFQWIIRPFDITVADAMAKQTPEEKKWLAELSTVSAPSRIQPFVDKHELAGAVMLVANKNKILSSEAVGFADVAHGKAMKTDSLFWIASQSKVMTATAVLMLMDEAKIALDDPVEKYLPEFHGQMVIAEKDSDHELLRKPAHPITIREVLSHMSGLPFASALETPTLDSLPLAVAVRSYAATPLQTEPGTHYEYSNAGINTAARILEVVSGMKYEDFMQQRLFTPLGMKDTTFWPTKEQARRLAKSYSYDEATKNLVEVPISQLIDPLTDRLHRFPMPAGGIFSTARDTALFCQMLLNGGEMNGRRYLSEAAFKELTRRQTPDSVQDSYGFGLGIGPNWFGHGGAYLTNMEIHPAQELVVIWMVQHSGYPGAGIEGQSVFKTWALERFGK